MGELKDNKSTRALLGTAKILFWKHGIKRISVDEICKNASVSKMTFYRYFENKYDLVSRLISEQIEGSLLSYDDIMQQDIAYGEKIKLILEFKQKQSMDLSMELIKDIYSGEKEFQELKDFMSKYQGNFMQRLKKDFGEAQRCGDIKAGLSIDFIIYMLNVMDKQLADPYLISMYENPGKLTEDLTTMFFYGILAK